MANIFDLFRQISKKDSQNEVLPITHIVAGLGNPGKKYEGTRHNAGFMAIDFIAEKLGVRIERAKFSALCGDCKIGENRVLLLKPQTFMNLSGQAVREAAEFYKIKPENIIILFDDIMLDVARLRVRRNGSDGGHNGIKSIICQLESSAFPRIKIGVGKIPHPDYNTVDWVLGKLSVEDISALNKVFPYIYDGLIKIIEGNMEEAMQICNSK